MLAGNIVQLEPLSLEHEPELSAIGLDASLWEVAVERVTSREEMGAYISRALADAKTQAYAVRHRASGRLAGSTRYMNMELAHHRLEIGSTWYGLEYQRTGVNTECKYLLLTHAFETMGLNRVELKTDGLNVRSQNAMRRIGAKVEGTLRRHMVTWSGRVRDTVYFSVIREEWPTVKAHLEELMVR
jgi:RimJ/RimL family protein N-acetyltransferase